MFKLHPYQVHYFDLEKDAWYIMDFETRQYAEEYMICLTYNKKNAEISLKVEA